MNTGSLVPANLHTLYEYGGGYTRRIESAYDNNDTVTLPDSAQDQNMNSMTLFVLVKWPKNELFDSK